jgi:hypothetical protein
MRDDLLARLALLAHTKRARTMALPQLRLRPKGLRTLLLPAVLVALPLGGWPASPGSLDVACLDALGYDGQQLAQHGSLAGALTRHVPSLALPVASVPGAFTQRAAFAPAACREIVRLVEQLRLMPSPHGGDPALAGVESQPLDSVDGRPEFQVDVLQHQPLVDLVWPQVERWIVPSLQELYGLRLRQMRVAEIFVRRYDSGVAGGRDRHPVHTDASTVSVSVELSDPAEYDGGLYLRTSARPASVAAHGSALYHYGNQSHHVSVTRGMRWSLVLFFFGSCSAQLRYNSAIPDALAARIRNAPDPRLRAEPTGVERPTAGDAVESGVDVIPRWLAAAVAGVVGTPLPISPSDEAGPFACPPGTEWRAVRGRCEPCKAGWFSNHPGAPAAAPIKEDAALVAVTCQPCRRGFFAP